MAEHHAGLSTHVIDVRAAIDVHAAIGGHGNPKWHTATYNACIGRGSPSRCYHKGHMATWNADAGHYMVPRTSARKLESWHTGPHQDFPRKLTGTLAHHHMKGCHISQQHNHTKLARLAQWHTVTCRVDN